jgi:16S rRNA (cytosine1402-N4)-methyltransferase
MDTASPHLSVLKNECLHYFEGKTLKIFVDCTLGAGGHSAAFLEAHPEIERHRPR